MRLLLDESLSPLVGERLVAAGYDVLHARDAGFRSVPDPVILEAAAEGDRVLVTLDTDFGALVARSSARLPSIVLLRGEVTRRPEGQATMLVANLHQVTDDLAAGAVVVIGDDRVRVRRLPIEGA